MTLALPRERVRCVPGMLNSWEVKVLYLWRQWQNGPNRFKELRL